MSETLEAIGGSPSLAAYFAAHAPEKVPRWFTELHKDLIPVDYPGPLLPTWLDAGNIIGRAITAQERGEVRDWIHDPCWRLPGDLYKFQEAMEKAQAQVSEDACEYQKAVFFAWRAFYGERMATMFGSRMCRGCGCTDLDCSGCIERTGVPCHWVEPDLCSACAQERAGGAAS